MPLVINTNIASLNAQHNLSRTTEALNRSLERLSTGVRINRGADGPANLVISEQQRAQIVGLEQAIENADKAISMIQTAEGALNEINRLLLKMRELALDSANTAVNDSDALAANQAEVENALETIQRIAETTQFGTKKLLDGSAGMVGIATDADVTVLRVTSTASEGTYLVNITTAAERAVAVAPTAQTAALAADEQLTINGVTIALTAGMTQADVVDEINKFTDQTGVIADTGGAGGATRLYTKAFGSGAEVSVVSDRAAATNSSGFGTAVITDTGVDIAGTIGGGTATGKGRVLIGDEGEAGEGISIEVAIDAANVIQSVSGAQGSVQVLDKSLVFQVGPNKDQTVSFAIPKISPDSLALGVNGNLFAKLSEIDLRSAEGAQDAIELIDQAIDEITRIRGDLGAFQTNTLESTRTNLRTALENLRFAESVIRDTDFAAEVANFTTQQVLLQAGAAVLTAANQTPNVILSLLS
jgi:flagellin